VIESNEIKTIRLEKRVAELEAQLKDSLPKLEQMSDLLSNLVQTTQQEIRALQEEHHKLSAQVYQLGKGV
jgi:predicted  nucleic acid-binding Zn-ribbon protein